MSTNFPPDGMQEANIDAPEAESQAEPQNNAWEPWQQAGWQPEEVNPYEVRQAYDGWQALGNRDTRGYMLERMLQGNELPEGMSWQEAQEAIQGAWQQRQDPFGAMQQQDPFGGYDPYGQQGMPSQQDYADAASQGIDAYQLREIWKQDMQQELQGFQQQLMAQQQEQQQVEEFTRGMDYLRNQNGLSESDLSFIAPRAAEYVQPGVPMQQAIDQAYKDFDEWRRGAIAGLATQQQQAPQQSYSQGGFTPSPDQPPRSLNEARQFMESQFPGR